jgi:hypothetical protein
VAVLRLLLHVWREFVEGPPKIPIYDVS